MSRPKVRPSHIRLDPVGGIAGDMFAAAALDAWPELEPGLLAALETAGILQLAQVARREHLDHGMTGSRFEVREAEGDAHEGNDPHSHRHHREVQDFLRRTDLPDPVRDRALDIFARLAEAESKVHGVAPDDVAFHEVGQWDSIADIVSAAWLIDALGAATWSCEPLPLGRGRVASAHGSLPVPAPATVRLLEGLPTVQDEVLGERVTPTGAAIVRHLNPSFEPVAGVLRIERSGTGFGTKVFEGLSNMLRLLAFERLSTDSRGWKADTVSVCSFEIDDQTGEDLAVALDRLRAVAGVLDVTQSVVVGKKGRLTSRIQALVEPAARERVIEACFLETTTLGIRWHTLERAVLEREEHVVRIDDRDVVLKRAQRPGDRVTIKAAMDDVGKAEGGQSERERFRQRAQASDDE